MNFFIDEVFFYLTLFAPLIAFALLFVIIFSLIEVVMWIGGRHGQAS